MKWTGFIALFAGLVLAGLVLPGWIVFQLGLALAKGMVVLGVMLLLRGGLISFGQAFFYAAGAYAAAFATQNAGVHNVLLLLLLAMLTGGLSAALIGLLMRRYRQIFFAMLSLAFSMVLYGLLLRLSNITGGSDGLSVVAPVVPGAGLIGLDAQTALYMVTAFCTMLALLTVERYLQSPQGYLMHAIRDNELRVEYLGVSAEQSIYITYIIAGVLGSLGGALVALNVGHVDPQYAFWTASAEFVVMAVLGGTGNVTAPLTGAIVFEFVRAYATQYAVSSWRLVLGAVLLIIVLFLPGGLWSLFQMTKRKVRAWR
jgi:branched-chain amino acid transport system permease protein